MKTENMLMLAPMEGVVDPWIRQLLSSYGGIDVCVTEFIRVTQQILPDHVFFEYAPELKTQSKTESGTPVMVQLLGSDLNFMAENAVKAVRLGALGIDINFGCPAKNVNRNDGGSVLLKNPERVYQITNAIRKALPMNIPVNAKVRLGYENKDFHKEIANAAEAAGAGWLVVHARTKEEGYRPPAHWEYIKAMKDCVHIPVIANGEIWTTQDFEKCRIISECENVMIGRGLMAEPLLAVRIKQQQQQQLANNSSISCSVNTKNFMANIFSFNDREYNLESEQDVIEFYLTNFVLKYIEICPKKATNFLVGRTKQLIKLLCRNHPGLNELFESIKPCQNYVAIQQIIQDYVRIKWP